MAQPEKFSYVKSIVDVLLNKDTFAATCMGIEKAVDRCAPNIRSCIVSQSSDVVKIAYEGFPFVDTALLASVRDAIPDAQYQFIRVVKPCMSAYVTESYTPITLIVQLGVSATIPPPEHTDDDPAAGYPKLQINNIRDLNIPENMRPSVLRILNMLYSGHGDTTPAPLSKVKFANKRPTLIITDPPTYSFSFLSEMVAAFPGVIADYRFEHVKDNSTGTTYLSVHLQQYASDPRGGGYMRSARSRGILSRFNPFS